MTDAAPSFRVLGMVSIAGEDGRMNEDRVGSGADGAFVVDGATGLGPSVLARAPHTDAAILAQQAALRFRGVSAGQSVVEAARDICTALSDALATSADASSLPGWALPVASFAFVQFGFGRAVAYGLGDCTVIARDRSGATFRFHPKPDAGEAEIEHAAALLKRTGGLDGFQRLRGDPSVMAILRDRRASHNSEGGLWTLGPRPEAANHVAIAPIDLEPPYEGLVMSDGFAALIDRYGRYDAAGLIDAALSCDLQRLTVELAQIEEADPQGERYPRFKRSDDASAVLFRVA